MLIHYIYFAVNSVFPSDDLRQLPDMFSYGRGFGKLSDMRLLQRLYHDGDRLWMWVCITPTQIWYGRMITYELYERILMNASWKTKNDTKNNCLAFFITIFGHVFVQFNVGVLVGWNARMLAILQAKVLTDFALPLYTYIYIYIYMRKFIWFSRSLSGYTIFMFCEKLTFLIMTWRRQAPRHAQSWY